ncbi:MAG TPA: GGDEF domain-containing protein [Burkholderiaceae bacterium]|nr:GGDEF domain-containing protein [Burkholderiaceae bacterium]
MLRAGVDLRPLLARERRAAPAVLVVAAWGALAAAPNAPYAWLWFMVVAASALGRVWIGITPERDRLALQPRDPGGLLYAGSYALDVTLWGLLFTAVAVPARLLDHGVGFAAGATLLLGALTLGGWRAAWLGWIAGWGAVALVVNLLTGVSHPVALGLPLWLAAVAWMSRRSSGGMHRPGTLHASRTTKLSTLHATRSHAPTLGASTRFEGPTGIGVLPTPVLVVRHSRIAEANQAAAQVLGHAEHALIGKRIDECMDVDPAHAFDPEHARVDKTAVRVTPKGNGAGAWMARVRVVEPGHAASAVVVALTRPVAAADGGGIAAEAQRFALGVGGARARPWYRDEAGRLVVPSGMVAPSVDGSRDPAVFPLRYCLVPADQARADALWRTARELGGVFDELLTLVDARGAKRTVRIVCVPRGPGGDVNVAPAGLIPAVVGALAPPRGARTFNEPLQPQLQEQLPILAWLVDPAGRDSAGQAIAVVKDGLVARCNDAFMELLQTQPALLQRTPIADYFATADEWRGIAAAADAARGEDRAAVREVQIRRGSRANGLIASWCQLTARSIAPGEYVVVLADIDQIRQRGADALHEAHHDELTGLPNRRLMSMRAATALAATALRNARCALMTVDLDGFKEINDQFGHEVGDQVLRTIAQRLAKVMRPQDTVARRGGDEFARLIPDVGARHDAERIAQRVLHAIEQPIVLDGEPHGVVSGSVGVAIAPDHGQDLERLLQLADLAMYEAKLRGKNCYAFAVAGGDVTASAPRTLRLPS